ncbi:ATP-binding protein [Effusibacillus lacus]|uniref:histidine kinase n=1 Tax=Effusibacillus lacus TaxID=1348429 RepID=A0A292YEP2_9BACL|nr:ATP-binding protein [Effusibacillus lacus]TCS76284.1 two-component system sensor histidine kinase ResE [Effusibacillus lacus]GAX91832.1 histidine kinase [Effusibacillus lacus]
MIRNSVVVKLWLTIIVLVVFVLSMLAVFLEQLFDTYFYSSQEEALKNRAAYISNLLIREKDQNLAVTVAEELLRESNSHMYIIGPLFTDREFNELEQFPTDLRERLEAGEQVLRRGTSPGFGQFRSETNSAWLIHPIQEENRLRSVLLIHQPVAEIEKAIEQIRNLIFFAAGIGGVLTTGLSFVVSKNLSRPVIQMTKVAEEMARGNYHGKVNVVTGDEVGKLGRTLNFLAKSLEETIDNLSKEKEQLSMILLSMTDGVVSADLDGKVTLANPPAKKWLRALTIEETGTPSEERLPKELNDLKNLVLENPETRVTELNWQGRFIALTMTPLYEPDGGPVRGIVAVFRDITEERTLERMRKDFVASVSHELRTPLAMMQGYGEALLDEFGEDPEQRRELTQIILDETNRMKRLVNDLLDLAQLEAGQFELHSTQIDLANVIRTIGRKFLTLANERQIQFRVSFDPNDAFPIEGDSDRLEQVFTNLIDNAMRHTPAGGSVTLDMRKEAGYIRIDISDTGEGIPTEDLPFIFERFYKVDKARTRAKGGTGLGLSITRNIVLKHRGEIIVSSTVGVGTTFTVILPLLGKTNTLHA